MSVRLLAPLAAVLVLSAPAAADDLPAKLNAKVNVEKFDGTFGDAVELFATKYDLPLVVDPMLEKSDDAAAQCDAGDRKVKLPKMSNVKLGTALRLLCDQVNGAYLVRPDHVRLTHAAAALYESGQRPIKPEDPGDDPPMFTASDMPKVEPLIKRALVSGAFKGRTVAAILDEIADTTGATVVLAPQAAEAAQKAVSVRFLNTPVDAAVRTLCEFAELGVIEDANVLLVTTRERADEVRGQRAAVAQERLHARAGLGVGLGGGIDGVPDAGELAGLRKEVEQLRGELNATRKFLTDQLKAEPKK